MWVDFQAPKDCLVHRMSRCPFIRGTRSESVVCDPSCDQRFKSIVDWDWSCPSKIDPQLVEELLQRGFIEEAANVILAEPNGVGKSAIAQNLAHHVLLRGHTGRCVTATPLDSRAS